MKTSKEYLTEAKKTRETEDEKKAREYIYDKVNEGRDDDEVIKEMKKDPKWKNKNINWKRLKIKN